MRKIQKTFSLEPLTSRMPSVWPAYKDDVLYFFDDVNLKKREYKYPSNYSMIPLKISLSGIEIVGDAILPTSTWDDVTIPSKPNECSFCISFERLSKWYYFFKEYYHLLNDYGHCNRTYSSATEYFYYESGARYADQMIYGTDEQTYIDLDEEFKSKGGIVDVDNIAANGAFDKGFYRWICDNIVPTYYISKEYSDYWKRNKLYYPDVVKWIAWFKSRLWYEDETSDVYSEASYDNDGEIIEREHWDCKNDAITNCCDCEEYFNRGGKREYGKMVAWYEAMQKSILDINSSVIANLDCFIPRMDDKIQLYNSLDDLGQYTIFSKEYELGMDYRTASYGDTENTHGGTVVEISGDTMILNGNKSGFDFSPYLMEKFYDETAWDDYTNMYMSSNSSEFIADGYKFYAFDESGKVYTGDTTQEVKENIINDSTYKIIPTDAILIEDTLFQIQKSEYGTYDLSNNYIGGKKFFVQRERETSTPYTLINGKKVYAEWYPYPNVEFDNKPCYYFSFFKNESQKTKGSSCDNVDSSFNITNYKPFGRTSGNSTNDVISYIMYLGQIFQVEDNAESIKIGELEYPRVVGYAYDKDNVIMYCVNVSGTTVVVYDYALKEVPNSEVIDDCIVIDLDYEPQIYNAKELSGQTISRLTDLELRDVLMDDIGNEIDGRYDPNKSDIFNHQPPEGTELDLLYEVGNVSNIRRFKLTAENMSDIGAENTNYFVGNIITDMVFYYKDVNGNVVDDTLFKWEDSSLETIHQSQAERDILESNGMIFDGEDIYCDITYYIGATLGRKNEGNFFLAYDENSTSSANYSYGVKYDETVKFVKENREYYLKKEDKKQIPTTVNSPSAHSVSYPIYVYHLKQDLKEIEAETYNTFTCSPLAAFKTEINLIKDDLSTNFSNYKDMDEYNNIHVSPTFKEEYMLSISSLENVDSDIYIERGINAAFEKHLKLGEITSMEALEQYGLNYFKIMEN